MNRHGPEGPESLATVRLVERLRDVGLTLSASLPVFTVSARSTCGSMPFDWYATFEGSLDANPDRGDGCGTLGSSMSTPRQPPRLVLYPRLLTPPWRLFIEVTCSGAPPDFVEWGANWGLGQSLSGKATRMASPSGNQTRFYFALPAPIEPGTGLDVQIYPKLASDAPGDVMIDRCDVLTFSA